jgi:competence ComEA-like helix-hairpin-helix protein
MTLEPIQTAIASLVLFLAVLVLAARIGELGRQEIGPLPTRGELCSGFVDDNGKALGVAFGHTASDLISTAIERLGLPEKCAALELPQAALRGGLVRFRIAMDRCQIQAVELLPGPQRRICGVGVDVNQDLALDLELLPGIGPKKAGSIVESREHDGPFGSIEDLARVKGIGQKTVEQIRPWVDRPR